MRLDRIQETGRVPLYLDSRIRNYYTMEFMPEVKLRPNLSHVSFSQFQECLMRIAYDELTSISLEEGKRRVAYVLEPQDGDETQTKLVRLGVYYRTWFKTELDKLYKEIEVPKWRWFTSALLAMGLKELKGYDQIQKAIAKVMVTWRWMETESLRTQMV
jgi:hypothetical protein